MFLYIFTAIAFLAFSFFAVALWGISHQQPRNVMHQLYLKRMHTVYVSFLCVSAMALGLALDRVLP